MSWEKIIKEEATDISESGFEIIDIDWQNQTEFIIRLKLIDEDAIYEGYCEIKSGSMN